VTPAALIDRMGTPLDGDDYDWDAAAEPRLTPEQHFQLTYAAHIEWGTEATFASLDVSDDPLVGRFLPIWLEQEVVHGELLGRFLATQGTAVAPVHTTRRQRFAARRGRLVNRAAVRALGADFSAVHMTWGAVNELTTLRFYALMRHRTENTVLAHLLGDVVAQEALHFAFYREMAARLLRDNVRAQRLTRWVMEHLWSPVGVGLRSREDAGRLMRGVFGCEPAEVRAIDARIDRLPGLRDLDLLGRLVASGAA
jgi:hypothetical protein